MCHLLELLGAHHILHVSKIRVKSGSLNLLKASEPVLVCTGIGVHFYII